MREKNLEVVLGDSSWHGLLDLSSLSSWRKKKKREEKEKEKEKPWRRNEWMNSRRRQKRGRGGWKIHERVFKEEKKYRCTTVLWRLIIAVIKMRGSCARDRGANWKGLAGIVRRNGGGKTKNEGKGRGRGEGKWARMWKYGGRANFSKVFSKPGLF